MIYAVEQDGTGCVPFGMLDVDTCELLDTAREYGIAFPVLFSVVIPSGSFYKFEALRGHVAKNQLASSKNLLWRS